jgi:enamine deaminase RidA (YjgF/YER057c/UK114 family)
MTKEVFDAFEGQQETFGYSQAVRVGDTIYVAGTLGIGKGLPIPEDMGEQRTTPTPTSRRRWLTSVPTCPTWWSRASL